MRDAYDEPEICPGCDGLAITRWARVEGIASISIDGGTASVGKVWIASRVDTCTQSAEQPARGPDEAPICTCTYAKRCPACRADTA
ncbi:hypothetical protein ACFWV1_13025 [Streptomyces sp. NPDC058700]|uniref:hypothetical protein n=1 Tax=Streptomyces sp. NPDC058700 TaxID=3346607 RepID=UPI003663B9CB